MSSCLEWIRVYIFCVSPLPIGNEEPLKVSNRSELSPWQIGGDKKVTVGLWMCVERGISSG